MSTGCRTEEAAQQWALERLIQMRRGHLVGIKERPSTWDDLERMLLDRWELDGRRGMMQTTSVLRRLRRAFSGWQTGAITSDRITSYAVRRKADGAAAATINLELAILHRGFALARESGRIETIPVIHRLPGVAHRTGTVERGDFDAILSVLPARYRPVVSTLYWTGWRESEVLGLTWQHVNLDAREIHLETSKTGQPRMLCFASVPALCAILDEARQKRTFGPYVFPGRAGKRMHRTALQKAWRVACRTVGVPGALIHDLRRTAVRDLRRAGVPLAVAMGAVGHASLNIHQGYSIVATEDQNDGMARLVALRDGEPIQRRFANLR